MSPDLSASCLNDNRSVPPVSIALRYSITSAQDWVRSQQSQQHSRGRARRLSAPDVMHHQAQCLRLLSDSQEIFGAAESGRALQVFNLLVSEAKSDCCSALRPQLFFEH